jgi:hypothetical protein
VYAGEIMTKAKSYVVTSLRVDGDLWKDAKIEAIKQGETLAKLIDRAIRNEIVKNKETATAQPSTNRNDQKS